MTCHCKVLKRKNASNGYVPIYFYFYFEKLQKFLSSFLKAFGNLMCMNYNPITKKEILNLFKPPNSQLNNNNIMHALYEYEKI